MASLRPAWELPFVNVFKLAGVEAGKHVAKEGDVAMVLDREIGKKVGRATERAVNQALANF
jgi:hypothetical protein